MPDTLSLDFKSSALLIALVLVPVVILFCAVAIALACSEYCSGRFRSFSCFSCVSCQKRFRRKKRLHSDLESGNGQGTESSESPLEYEQPVRSRSQF
ncbi:hypothetical protein N7532_007912 [Penicillium argentinense]|uniref:Uncharacterized protein n=1 Tax=Penicillium argentinense TaxID=1131581 RepID=A0A9W9EWE3_9EURO|nr:uncharacterized protein N7532_007912 [Penicillium argentinense]KAJ5089228.1 hypothetical protein N7532_007912 [Penicillium argentinense]